MVFVDNYNKAKLIADLLFWLVLSLGIFFLVLATFMCGHPVFGVLAIEILYNLLLYIPEIRFDPRKADTREFDEVGYIIDENDLFNQTCLGDLGQISLQAWTDGMEK